MFYNGLMSVIIEASSKQIVETDNFFSLGSEEYNFNMTLNKIFSSDWS